MAILPVPVEGPRDKAARRRRPSLGGEWARSFVDQEGRFVFDQRQGQGHLNSRVAGRVVVKEITYV